MEYLCIRVVKARDLPVKDVTDSLDRYVELRLGNYKEKTCHFEAEKVNLEWNQVFTFSKENIQASKLEVTLKDKDFVDNDFIGCVMFHLNEIPEMVPSDCPLAPQWYRLEDRNGTKVRGELLLAVWMGTPADETLAEAWHSDVAAVKGDKGLDHLTSKVYLSPKLWYLRVNVIEVQGLIPSDKSRFPGTFVEATVGYQTLRTRVSMSYASNPIWKEDLMFVAAEPFEETLILSLEEKVATNKEAIIGRCVIPLSCVDRTLDDKRVTCRWFNLEKHVIGGETKHQAQFVGKILTRICLEGGYHVMDDSTQYIGDLRPSAKQLWKSSIGVLELGILNAEDLSPMKRKEGRATTDAYCVAKYGHKWFRTSTVIDSFTPEWNEHYTWEVYDPCTVITIVVLDNCHLQGGDKYEGTKDLRIGKVRIRLSTLEADCLYQHCFPLLVLDPTGVKKMGEIHLTVRFLCSSSLSMMHMYSKPLLPKMHYVHPLSIYQENLLRHQAVQIVSMRLNRAEPPLRKEVVEYMFDVGSNLWSMRRSKTNLLRIMDIFGDVGKWYDQICNWRNPIATVFVHILFVMIVQFPKHSLTTIFLSLSLIGAWNYRWKPRNPPDSYTHLSCIDGVHHDELYEEFDSFPTNPDIVSLRYDRLRSMAGRIQTLLGDLAALGERLYSLLQYRDPRATALFVIFCFFAFVVVEAVSSKVVALLIGFYVLRHPCVRFKVPPAPLNFLGRLPTREHLML